MRRLVAVTALLLVGGGGCQSGAGVGDDILNAARVTATAGDRIALVTGGTYSRGVESHFALLVVDPATGAVVGRDTLGTGVGMQTGIAAHGPGRFVVETPAGVVACDATTGAHDQQLPSVPPELVGPLAASHQLPREVTRLPLGTGDELALRGYDQRRTLVHARNGVAQPLTSPAVFWKGAFLTADGAPILAREPAGAFVAGYDDLGTNKRPVLARVTAEGQVVWSITPANVSGSAQILLTHATTDALVLVYGPPTSAVVAYDLADGHVHWRVTP